jgi:predicted nuclease with RNAse H fold
MSTHLYLGFDPGGETKRNFGWCLVEGNKKLTIVSHGRVSNAQKALEATKNFIEEVSAVGIDAPLFWRCDGCRIVDQIIHQYLPRKNRSTVIQVNSLAGACLVQGMMTAMLIQEKYPSLRITESHPKAIRYLLRDSQLRKYFNSAAYKKLKELKDSHILDAAISALSAWVMINEPKKGWVNLYKKEKGKENGLISPLKSPPEYWMPIGR